MSKTLKQLYGRERRNKVKALTLARRRADHFKCSYSVLPVSSGKFNVERGEHDGALFIARPRKDDLEKCG
jgi:hypothetical protein